MQFHVNAGTVPLASQILYAPTFEIVPQQIRRRSGRIAFTPDRDQCAVASVDNPRTQLDKVQIQTIELVFGEDNTLDDATADGRDKLRATAMVKQFEKNFPELLTPRELKFKSSKLTASSLMMHVIARSKR